MSHFLNIAIHLLLNSAAVSLLALFGSVIWMLRDPKDRSRPIVVLGLFLNMFYSLMLTCFLSGEDSLFPWKYDEYLARIDQVLGVSAGWVAIALRGPAHRILEFVYQLMVPMMIYWYVLNARWKDRAIAIAYVAEMAVGPLLYAALPACGPVYAFGTQWATSIGYSVVPVNPMLMSGMPNAFPSLHIATALVFVAFSQTSVSRVISISFLATTGLATLTTGEHYVIDLIAGLSFGCFASQMARRRVRPALLYLGIVVLWCASIRFELPVLIANAWILRSLAALTIISSIAYIYREWNGKPIFSLPTATWHRGSSRIGLDYATRPSRDM
jgi:hypothetical protein